MANYDHNNLNHRRAAEREDAVHGEKSATPHMLQVRGGEDSEINQEIACIINQIAFAEDNRSMPFAYRNDPVFQNLVTIFAPKLARLAAIAAMKGAQMAWSDDSTLAERGGVRGCIMREIESQFKVGLHSEYVG